MPLRKKRHLLFPLLFFVLITAWVSCSTDPQQAKSDLEDTTSISEEDSLQLFHWQLKSTAAQRTAPDSAIYFAQRQVDLSFDKDLLNWQGNALYNLGTGFFYAAAYDSAALYLNRALSHPHSKEPLKGRCLHNLGLIYSRTGNFEKATDSFEKAIAIYEKNGNLRGISMARNMMGSMLIRQDQYEAALDQYLQSLAIIDSTGDESRRYKLVGNIGGTFEQVGELEKALDFYEQAEVGAKSFNDRFTLAYIERTKGGLFIKMDRFDQAKQSLEIAKIIFDSVQNKAGLTEVEGYFGDLYKKQGKIEQAGPHYQEALRLSKLLNDPSKIMIHTANLATFHMARGDRSKAITEYQQVAFLADTLQMDQDFAQAQQQLSTLYREEGQFNEALMAMETYMEIQQSIFDKEKAKAVAELQTQFETSEQEKRILQLTSEKAESDSKNTKQRLWIFAILMLLLIAVVTTILFYQLSKTRAQAATEKGLLLDEMHHRTKNNLAIVESLLRVQEGEYHPEQTYQLLEQSRSRIKSIALVHQLLYQSKEEQASIDLNTYLPKLIEQIAKNTPGGLQIDFKGQLDQAFLGIQKAIPFCLIANELIINALQHAFPQRENGQITVRLTGSDKTYWQLQVEDDGIGISSDFQEGYGWRLIRGLARQLKGQIDLLDGSGSCIHLTIPIETNVKRPAHYFLF